MNRHGMLINSAYFVNNFASNEDLYIRICLVAQLYKKRDIFSLLYILWERLIWNYTVIICNLSIVYNAASTHFKFILISLAVFF